MHVGADGLAGSSNSLGDYNRAGTPLVEIVSEPDLRSGREAAAYGAELQRLVVSMLHSLGLLQRLVRCRGLGGGGCVPLPLTLSAACRFASSASATATWRRGRCGAM